MSRLELEGTAYLVGGDRGRAEAALGEARFLIEKELETFSDDHRYRAAHGRILALLGERDAALAAGKRAVELIPISADLGSGAIARLCLALIHARVGEPGAAIELLEWLLARPTGLFLTRAMLRLDPAWDRLRGHPRFERLIGEGEPGAES